MKDNSTGKDKEFYELGKKISGGDMTDTAKAFDAVEALTEDGWIWDGDQWQRPPQQEPVAWMTINDYGEEDDIHYECPEGHLMEGWTYKPLYTTPPVAPVQEPLEYWTVAEGWVKIDEVREHFDSVGCGTIYKTAGEDRVPVYTAPPQRPWVGLTDEEINSWDLPVLPTLAVFARFLEAKLRSKNNAP